MMKKLKLAVVALFTLLAISNVNAQDADNPWVFSLGVNAVDFRVGEGLGDISKDYLGTTDWNVLKSISRFSVEKYIDYGITVQAAFSLSELKTLDAKDGIDGNYYAFDINGKYDLNEAFGDTSWFDPYVLLGASYTVVDFAAEDFKEVMLNIGYGFNFWVDDNLAINFQSIAKRNLSDKITDHFQHSLGVVFKFGGSNDDTE